MPSVEVDDPGKTIDQIVAEMPECLSMSAICFSERIEALLKEHPNRWVGVRYRYGAEPLLEFADTDEELDGLLQRKYPRTESAFSREHLTPEALQIYLG